MSHEGNAECHRPAEHVGGERAPVQQVHGGHHHAPVHAGGAAPDQQKPRDASVSPRHRPGTGGRGVQSRAAVHAAAEHSDERALCLCLDDFGLSAGINQAALQLIHQGRLHAVSCMVGTPAFAQGVPALRALQRTTCDVGLHLDLTEAPIGARRRGGLRRLIVDGWLGRADRRVLRQEVDAQLDAFEQAVGRAPDHVDGHQHVHQLPVVREVLLDALASRATGPRPWLRSTRPAPSPGAWRERFKSALIASLGEASLREAACRRGFRLNGRLLGVYDFRGGAAAYVDRLMRWLAVSTPGDLLMCHAGSGPSVGDPIAAARVCELEVLGGPVFDDLLRAQRIRLQPMSAILAGLAPP